MIWQRNRQSKGRSRILLQPVYQKGRMEKAERLRSKYLYKVVLLVLKIIPVLLTVFDVVNTTLGFAGVECHWLSYFGGISLFTIVFLLLVSFVFGFCSYHRMFLYYILVTNTLHIIDYEFGLPVSNLNLLRIHIVIFGLFLFLVLYLHQHEKLKALSPAND